MQMIYLTNAKKIEDESDYEDSIELIMKSRDTRSLDPSNNQNQESSSAKNPNVIEVRDELDIEKFTHKNYEPKDEVIDDQIETNPN